MPLLLGGAALVVLARFDRRALLLPLWMIGVTLLLIANGSRSLLPLSAALYPDRLPLLLLLPIALLLWSALGLLAPRLRAGWMRQAALGAALLLAAHAVDLQRKLVENGREHELLTPDDLALLAREAPRLPPGCFVANNYGDGGQWLPALFDRPITLPQVNVVWFSEMPLRAHPCAAFRGARLAYSIDGVTPLCRAGSCQQVAQEGAAAWFAVTDAALRVEARGAR